MEHLVNLETSSQYELHCDYKQLKAKLRENGIEVKVLPAWKLMLE